MNDLYSHPDKKLSEHLHQVAEASQIIASYHFLDEVTKQRLDELVRLHDFGKGTTFFQDYITYKPEPWTNDPESKRHTPLGMLASAIIKEKNTLANDWLLQIGASVLGHHTKLPTRHDIVGKLENDRHILLKQISKTYLEQLAPLIGFAFDSSDFISDKSTTSKAIRSYKAL